MSDSPQEQPKQSWWRRLSAGLKRTSSSIGGAVAALVTKRKLDRAMLEDIEDVLLRADLGSDVAARIAEAVGKGRYDKDVSAEDVINIVGAEVEKVLAPVAKPLEINTAHKPFVILVVGVNGSGKTTTIGKLASKLTAEGRKVMLAAGDTFRAAAIEQLKVWGERNKVPVVAKAQGSDAASLAFEAVEAAKAENVDVLLIDTAGRLQNKTELMVELEKVRRVIGKVDATAPHAVLLVLDATVGQNALSQVDAFHKTAGVTGLVMTSWMALRAAASLWRCRKNTSCRCISSASAKASMISRRSPHTILPARLQDRTIDHGRFGQTRAASAVQACDRIRPAGDLLRCERQVRIVRRDGSFHGRHRRRHHRVLRCHEACAADGYRHGRDRAGVRRADAVLSR